MEFNYLKNNYKVINNRIINNGKEINFTKIVYDLMEVFQIGKDEAKNVIINWCDYNGFRDYEKIINDIECVIKADSTYKVVSVISYEIKESINPNFNEFSRAYIPSSRNIEIKLISLFDGGEIKDVNWMFNQRNKFNLSLYSNNISLNCLGCYLYSYGVGNNTIEIIIKTDYYQITV